MDIDNIGGGLKWQSVL